MIRKYMSLGLALGFFVLMLFALKATMGYQPMTKIFPLAFISTTLILLGIQIVREIRPQQAKSKATTADIMKLDTTGIRLKELIRRFATIGAWVVFLPVIIYLVGWVATIPVYSFAYFKTHNVGWVKSVVLATFLGLFFYFGFVVGLGMYFPPGLLFEHFLGWQ